MTTCLLRGVALGILLIALRISAATTAWSYQADMMMFQQVVADGAGGCSIIAISTNGLMYALRLNSKGAEVYRYQLS